MISDHKLRTRERRKGVLEPARDKYRIFSDVLTSAGTRNQGSTIREVIKEASLSLEQAKEIILDMLEIGLLDFNDENRTLTTTKKGWKFVWTYQNLIAALS